MTEKKDYGTPELRVKMGVTHRNGLSTVYAQYPLDIYLQQMLIDDKQYLAGDKLFRYFEYIGGMRLKILNIHDNFGIDLLDEDASESREKFRRKYIQAVRNISPKARPVTLDVCCYQQDVTGNPAKVRLLKEGLKDLIKFFGL